MIFHNPFADPPPPKTPPQGFKFGARDPFANAAATLPQGYITPATQAAITKNATAQTAAIAQANATAQNNGVDPSKARDPFYDWLDEEVSEGSGVKIKHVAFGVAGFLLLALAMRGR